MFSLFSIRLLSISLTLCNYLPCSTPSQQTTVNDQDIRINLLCRTVRNATTDIAKKDSIFYAHIHQKIARLLTNNDTTQFKTDSLTIKVGSFFDKQQRHAIVEIKPNHLLNHIYTNSITEVWTYQNQQWLRDSIVDMREDFEVLGYYIKDINGDNTLDFVFRGHSSAGTGIKFFDIVYLYNLNSNNFKKVLVNETDYLSNPYYHVDKKQVTTYYIAANGGNCQKYEWQGLESKQIEEIEIKINSSYQYVAKIYKIESNKRILQKGGSKIKSFKDLEKLGYLPYQEVEIE